MNAVIYGAIAVAALFGGILLLIYAEVLGAAPALFVALYAGVRAAQAIGEMGEVVPVSLRACVAESAIALTLMAADRG